MCGSYHPLKDSTQPSEKHAPSSLILKVPPPARQASTVPLEEQKHPSKQQITRRYDNVAASTQDPPNGPSIDVTPAAPRRIREWERRDVEVLRDEWEGEIY
jgi:hypothetical protein